jgi:hypothetical protein
MVVERGVQRLVVNFRRVAMFCAEPYRHIPFKRGPLDSFRHSLGTPETREQMILPWWLACAEKSQKAMSERRFTASRLVEPMGVEPRPLECHSKMYRD